MARIYTQEDMDRAMQREQARTTVAVQRAVQHERARSDAVRAIYQKILAEKDKNESIIRDQLSRALDYISDQSQENKSLRCEVLQRALRARLEQPRSCALCSSQADRL